jgi:malate/lactate dehydrogenase
MTRLSTLTETIQNLRARYYTLVKDIFTHANQIINLATHIENEKEDENILYTNVPIIIQLNEKIDTIFDKLQATIQKLKENIQNTKLVQPEEKLWSMSRDDVCK